MSFTVAQADAEKARGAAMSRRGTIGFDDVSVDTDIAKVSVVGAGMMSNSAIAALVFEALNDENINIQMISTSEIKLSVILAQSQADRAVAAIHRKFFES